MNKIRLALSALIRIMAFPHSDNSVIDLLQKNRITKNLAWLLLCLCLPTAESKLKASGSIYFDGSTNSYMQFSGPFYGGTILDDYAIEFWFRPDTNASQIIFSTTVPLEVYHFTFIYHCSQTAQ